MNKTLLHPAATDGGGGADFEGTVLAGVETLTQAQKAAATRLDNLTGETKTALADIAALKLSANSVTEAVTKLTRAHALFGAEVRRANPDPARRILADPDKRGLFNAAVLKTIGARVPDSLKEYTKSLTEGATPGSTYIIGELARDVYDVLATYGIWNTFRVVPVGTKTTTFPVTTARAVAAWITTQGGEISEDSTKAGTSVDCAVLTAAILLGVSNELLEDAEIDVAAEVLRDFGQGAAYRLDHACLAADGTADATHGGFTGVFSGGTAATAAAGNTTVGTLELDDFIRCLTTVAAGVLRRPCRWWIHPHILAKICGIKDENGRPIFQTALEAPAPGAIGSLLGYPVVLADAAPSTDSAGNVVAVFGDPDGLVVGLRQAFSFAASTEHFYNYNKTAFRGLVRAGIKIRAATAFAKLTLAAA